MQSVIKEQKYTESSLFHAPALFTNLSWHKLLTTITSGNMARKEGSKIKHYVCPTK